MKKSYRDLFRVGPVGVCPRSTQAQTITFRVQVPFPFVVGNQARELSGSAIAGTPRSA
jgi:hypothetical protein